MERQVYQIKGLPLIKFQDRDKIEALQNGIIYMKSLEYYRTREFETGDDTVGDLFEAMIHANDGYLIIPELGIKEKLSDTLLKTSFSNYFAFCMFEISELSTFEFSEEQKEKLVDFGDSALLITDQHEFLRRITVALTKLGIKGYHGCVTYYDESKDHVDYWTNLMTTGMHNIAFYKRKRYAYQQEYRLLIEPPATKDDYYKLDIGSISDISILLSTKEILRSMVRKEGM